MSIEKLITESPSTVRIKFGNAKARQEYGNTINIMIKKDGLEESSNELTPNNYSLMQGTLNKKKSINKQQIGL